MSTELASVGFGNVLAANRIVLMATPAAAPIKRLVQEARAGGLLLDLTGGRRTKAVVLTDSGHVLLAAFTPETLAGRVTAGRAAAPLG